MPNLNEFISSKDEPNNMEKIEGKKPCGECNLDSNFYYWNPVSLEMIWTCEKGHKNSYRIN